MNLKEFKVIVINIDHLSKELRRIKTNYESIGKSPRFDFNYDYLLGKLVAYIRMASYKKGVDERVLKNLQDLEKEFRV